MNLLLIALAASSGIAAPIAGAAVPVSWDRHPGQISADDSKTVSQASSQQTYLSPHRLVPPPRNPPFSTHQLVRSQANVFIQPSAQDHPHPISVTLEYENHDDDTTWVLTADAKYPLETAARPVSNPASQSSTFKAVDNFDTTPFPPNANNPEFIPEDSFPSAPRLTGDPSSPIHRPTHALSDRHTRHPAPNGVGIFCFFVLIVLVVEARGGIAAAWTRLVDSRGAVKRDEDNASQPEKIKREEHLVASGNEHVQDQACEPADEI